MTDPNEAQSAEALPEAEPVLADLVWAGEYERLEEAWLDRVEDPGEIAPFEEAIAALLQRNLADRAVTLATLLIESLVSGDRHRDALAIIRRTARAGKPKDVQSLHPHLLASLEGLYGKEDWLPLLLEKSGLEGKGPIAKTLEEFEALLPYRPGCSIIHHSERRPAQIITLDVGDGTALIRSIDGSERRLSLEVTRELHGPLDPEDWRALQMTGPEILRKEALDSPGSIIRNVARSRGGKVAAPQLKSDLHGAVIPAEKWNSWWKRAKEDATRDPHLSVEGTRTRPVFVARERPLSLEEEALRKARWAAGIPEAVAVVRQYRKEGISAEAAEALAKEVVRRIESEAEALRKKSPGVLLEAGLALEAWGGQSPIGPDALLEEAIRGEPEILSHLVQTIPSEEGRSAVFARIEERIPGWQDRIVRILGDLSGGPLEEALDRLDRAGSRQRVCDEFRRWLESPYRHRDAVIHLLKDRKLVQEIRPPELLDGLIVLARDLTRPPRGGRPTPRLLRLLVDWLHAGKNPRIAAILDQAEPADLERWAVVVESTPDLPWEIAEPIRARGPETEPSEPLPFLEGKAIYSTRQGIARRKEDLRLLVEERIPANRKAIGDAAAHGDLSDNAEYQAALEEQQNLAEHLRITEDEIVRAVPMENLARPPGVVFPGIEVAYREIESGEEKVIRILGPWDEGDGIVSYRAPLARGLLGRKVGEQVTIALPSRSIEVRIERVEADP